MPKFDYRGIDADGGEISGSLIAGEESFAISELAGRGIHVYEIGERLQRKTSAPWYLKEVRLGPSGVNEAAVAEFCQSLATMLGAGVSLHDALDISSRSAPSRSLRASAGRMRQSISEGLNFGDAVREGGTALPSEMVLFASAGSMANDLPQSMSEAARYFRQRSGLHRSILSSLAYPAFLLAGSVAVFSMLIFVLVPTLYSAMASSGKEGTGLIGTLESLRRWIDAHSLAATGGLVVGVTLFVLLGWQVGPSLLRRMPITRDLSYFREYARVSTLVATLISAGMRLEEAMSHAGALAKAPDAKELLEDARARLMEGKDAAHVFMTDRHVPVVFARLFQIGESSNRLPETLALAASILDQSADGRAKALTTAIGPAATSLVGCFIGTIVYFLISAMLEVNQVAF